MGMIAKYSKKFPYAPYLNEDIGYDISIPDNASDEEMIEAIVRLNRVATAAYYRLNPQIKNAAQMPQGQQIVPEVQVEKGDKGGIENEITNCPDIRTLQTYALMVQQYPSLAPIYNQRKKELSIIKKKNGKPVLP